MDSAFNGGALAKGTFSVGTVEVPEEIAGRPAFGLSPAYPNPLRAATRFTLQVDRLQDVRIDVYEVKGRRVAFVHDGALAAGSHRFGLDATMLPSGTYFIHASGRGRTAIRRVTLVR